MRQTAILTGAAGWLLRAGRLKNGSSGELDEILACGSFCTIARGDLAWQLDRHFY
jgi:hypothetical protein